MNLNAPARFQLIASALASVMYDPLIDIITSYAISDTKCVISRIFDELFEKYREHSHVWIKLHNSCSWWQPWTNNECLIASAAVTVESLTSALDDHGYLMYDPEWKIHKDIIDIVNKYDTDPTGIVRYYDLNRT